MRTVLGLITHTVFSAMWHTLWPKCTCCSLTVLPHTALIIMSLSQATQPVQEYMNMPLDAQRLQQETARYLPQPLYILYVQASAYKEACDPHLEVKILGDLDVAKAAMEAKTAARGLSTKQTISNKLLK